MNPGVGRDYVRRSGPGGRQSTSIAPDTQLSAHFQHDVQARLLTITGRPSWFSITPSGQTIEQTPLISHASESITIGMPSS
jgi:hypothetical protein